MVEQIKNITDYKKEEEEKKVFYTYVNLELFLNHSGHSNNWLISWNGQPQQWPGIWMEPFDESRGDKTKMSPKVTSCLV